jgi:hypothetical protein
MASVPCLPPLENPVISSGRVLDPVQERLFHDYRVEVPIVNWPMSATGW